MKIEAQTPWATNCQKTLTITDGPVLSTSTYSGGHKFQATRVHLNYTATKNGTWAVNQATVFGDVYKVDGTVGTREARRDFGVGSDAPVPGWLTDLVQHYWPRNATPSITDRPFTAPTPDAV